MFVEETFGILDKKIIQIFITTIKPGKFNLLISDCKI